MRLTPDNGGFVIEAEDLGPLLGIPADQVQTLMARGEITSLLEAGEGEDDGRFRLTFRHGGLSLRLTVNAEGEVLMKSRITRATPPTRSRP